jgi:hypothetical protein
MIGDGTSSLFMLPPPFTDHLTRDLDRSTFQICVQSSLCAFCALRSLCGIWLRVLCVGGVFGRASGIDDWPLKQKGVKGMWGHGSSQLGVRGSPLGTYRLKTVFYSFNFLLNHQRDLISYAINSAQNARANFSRAYSSLAKILPF